MSRRKTAKGEGTKRDKKVEGDRVHLADQKKLRQQDREGTLDGAVRVWDPFTD